MSVSATAPVPAVPRAASLLGLDPATYAVHPVHLPEGRAFRETNCYADVVVELLHARGDEPLAVLGAALRVDFEGDQWTFLKPAPGDLEALLGIDVHEMQPYRPLDVQLAEQLAAGRTMVVELDGWHLPDTTGTSYRAAHVKTSVAVEAIDRDLGTLRYFHNAGYFELGGEDYRHVLGLAEGSAPALPPYCDLVRFDAGPRLEGDALRAAARERTARHLARRPVDNPWLRFGERLAGDVGRLAAGAEDFDAYAFATVRMAGAAFELAASHVEWLLGRDGEAAAADLRTLVEGCQVLLFRLARRRPFDPAARIAELARAWDSAMAELDLALR